MDEKGLWNETLGQLGATLKALENEGVTLTQLAQIRANKRLAAAVADLLMGKDSTLPSTDDLLLKLLSITHVFGSKHWRYYWNVELSSFIDLPIVLRDLEEITRSPCPFKKNKKVGETHFMFYLPKEVDGVKLTIRKWRHMMPRTKQPCFYKYENDLNNNYFYDDSRFTKFHVARYHWFLMYPEIIPGSENKTLAEQLKMVPCEYLVPKAVECVPLHFLSNATTGKRINLNTYGRTCDKDSENHSHLVVGSFNEMGLDIDWRRDETKASNLGIFTFRVLV